MNINLKTIIASIFIVILLGLIIITLKLDDKSIDADSEENTQTQQQVINEQSGDGDNAQENSKTPVTEVSEEKIDSNLDNNNELKVDAQNQKEVIKDQTGNESNTEEKAVGEDNNQENNEILTKEVNSNLQIIDVEPESDLSYEVPLYIYIIIIISLLLALSGVWISYWLYKWRKIIISKEGKNNVIIVPEEFWESQQKIFKNFNDLAENVSVLNENLNKDIDSLNKQYNELMDNFLTLRKALDERDAEIKKLKEGYDQTIIKKSLRRFLKTHQSVSDSYKENPSDQLEQILYLFNDALEEAGVEIFSPELNALYSKTDGLSENPKKITAPNKEDVGKIQQVNEEGYRMKIPSGYEYLIPSKVTIYIEENTEEK
jgi:hypothetical protein